MADGSESLLDSLPRMPTSRFSAIPWPAWPKQIMNHRYRHAQLFGGGIQYIEGWLQSDAILAMLEPAINDYISLWNPAFREHVREWIVLCQGNLSRFATFHAGANWMLWKLRTDMPADIAQRGLAECLDVMEVGLHKEFIFWMKTTNFIKMRSAFTDFALGEDDGVDENDAAGDNDGDDEAGSEQHGNSVTDDEDADTKATIGTESGEQDEFAIQEKPSGRIRNRAKSKKAKTAAKRAKGKKAA